MNGRGGENGTETTIVLHRQGAALAMLIPGADGGVEAARVTQEEARSRIAALAKSKKGDGVRVVRVLPGARTICRVAPVPAGNPSELSAAARLISEAHLPESIPPHRFGAGVLPEAIADAAASEGRTALLTAWRYDAKQDDPPLNIEGVDETWTSVPAALGFLIKSSGSVGPAWYADGGDGSISLIQGAGEKTLARVVVEDNSSRDAWRESIRLTTGEDPGDVPLEPLVSLPSGVSAPLPAWRGEDAWKNQFAVAIGAYLLATRGDAAAQGLADIRHEPPKVREPGVVRALGRLASPRTAGWVTAACVALLVAAPLGLAWARYAVLDKKARGLDTQKASRKDLDKRAAVYRELESERWPMTKLLADLSRATPEGVTVTNLTLAPTEGGVAASDQGLVIQGTAKTREIANELVNSLNQSNVFAGARARRVDFRGDAYEFDIVAAVTSPHIAAKVPEKSDWVAEPLAKRLYGEKGSNLTPPAGSAADEERSSRRTARASTEDDEGSGGGGSSSRSSRTPPAETLKPGESPKPLADDEISTMDRSKAMREMVTRRNFSQKNPSLDQATKRRLDDEVAKLRARLDVLKTAGGTATKDGGKGAPK